MQQIITKHCGMKELEEYEGKKIRPVLLLFFIQELCTLILINLSNGASILAVEDSELN